MSEQEQAGVEQQAAELEGLAAMAGDDAPGVDGEFIPGQDQDQGGQGAAGPETADILAPMLQITFGLVAAKRGAHWALSDAEAVEAGRAYGAVIDKYFPGVAMGPEVTAVMVTLAIFGPRMMQDKAQAAEKARREQQQAEEKREGAAVAEGLDDGD